MNHVFVWTVDDVIGAVLLGIFLLFLVMVVVLLGVANLMDWIKAKFKKKGPL